MSNNTSTALYPHPFSKAYWRDAANEMNSTKMLVVTALMVALRIVLKPFAIYIAPQLAIQTAMLATALGAMIFGPVIAIPAAIVSDTIGFMLFPTGDYFLPFVLTEIASTMIYALFLYRAKVTPIRVMLARFCICLFVNVMLQQVIFAWQYIYMGNPEKAMSSITGMMSVARIFKNLCFFPIETVVLTLFLRFLLPVTQRAKLTFCGDSDMKFTKAAVAVLVALMVVGSASSVGYLAYRYTDTSRSADFTDEQRVEENKAATQIVLDKTDDWDDQTVVCIVDSAFRPLFGEETEYTVSVYVLDQEKFDVGVSDAAANGKEYGMDALWGYSKSGPGKDKYGSMIKVATVKYIEVEKTGDIPEFNLTPVE
jgi:ECF transporter S component (folate family)